MMPFTLARHNCLNTTMNIFHWKSHCSANTLCLKVLLFLSVWMSVYFILSLKDMHKTLRSGWLHS